MEPSILRRYHAAADARRRWDPLLGEAYGYALPECPSPVWGRSEVDRRGERRGIEVYDATAPDALDERAKRTHGLLFPAFQEWTAFQPINVPGRRRGGLGRTQTKTNDVRIAAETEAAVETLHAAIDRSNFHTEILPALRESYISLGVLNVNVGTPDDPLQFEAVPINRVAVEESPDGVNRTVFLRLDLSLSELAQRYPEAELPTDLAMAVSERPTERIAVVEANLWNPKHRTVVFTVWLDEPNRDRKRCIHREQLHSQRTIAFRVDKVPGESMGRGPIIKALPDIKTANKTVELILKNASISVTGIWQADDDGVLNPANVILRPGAIIPKAVGSSGLTPLAAPGDFDVSQLVLERLQSRIKDLIAGPALPPADEAVRTAFELGERRADQRAVEVPETLRLLNELYDPLVRRCLAILSDPSMAGSRYYIPPIEIDETRIRLVPTSPLVRIQDEQFSNQALGALSAATQFVGSDVVAGIVRIEETIAWFLEKNRFPASLTFTDDERAAKAVEARRARLLADAGELASVASDEGSPSRLHRGHSREPADISTVSMRPQRITGGGHG